MLRECISNGDLVQLQPTWFGFGSWKLHRNLSEEGRILQELEEEAKSKYIDLSHKNVVASANIADKLETLQILLLENSDAYFEVGIDNSILEKRDGVKYNYSRGNSNNKQGQASSNKDKQQNQNNDKSNNGQRNGGNEKGRRSISIAELFSGKIVLH